MALGPREGASGRPLASGFSGALGDQLSALADTSGPGFRLRPGLVLLGSRAWPGAPGALAISPFKSKHITFLPAGATTPPHCYHRNHGKGRKRLEKGIIKTHKDATHPSHPPRVTLQTLGSALPLTVMAKVRGLPRVALSLGPVPPRLEWLALRNTSQGRGAGPQPLIPPPSAFCFPGPPPNPR